jgi:hypothetical protein
MRGKNSSGGGGKRRMKGGVGGDGVSGLSSVGGVSGLSSVGGVGGVGGLSGVGGIDGIGDISGMSGIGSISSMSGISSASISDWMTKIQKNLKKIFKFSLFKFLVYMLLVISCIYLVFATIIFVNACINLHKTSFVYPTDDTIKYRKLIDAPIFEYLKTKNFLAVDKFLLNANNSLKPSSVAFWTVTGIMIGTILFLIAHNYMLSDKEEVNEYKTYLMKNKSYVLMALLPYLLIFIIVIWFNTIQVNNNNDLNSLKINGKIQYKKEELQEIKKKLQKILYENETFTTSTVTDGIADGIEARFKPNRYIAPEKKSTVSTAPVPANTSVGNKIVAIDLEAIISIYKHNLKALNLSRGDELKQYQRKYINYIDEYFELLKYNSSSGGSSVGDDDYYTEFYLYGLIEYKDGDEKEYSYRILEYRNKIKSNEGGSGLEKLLITTITSNIRAYFTGVISLYTICAIGVIIMLIYLNDAAKTPLVHLLFIIDKIASINNLPIIILAIIAIAAIIITLFFVIPLIYNWAAATLSWMLN